MVMHAVSTVVLQEFFSIAAREGKKVGRTRLRVHCWGIMAQSTRGCPSKNVTQNFLKKKIHQPNRIRSKAVNLKAKEQRWPLPSSGLERSPKNAQPRPWLLLLPAAASLLFVLLRSPRMTKLPVRFYPVLEQTASVHPPPPTPWT